MKMYIAIFSYVLPTSGRVDRYLLFWKWVIFEELLLYSDQALLCLLLQQLKRQLGGGGCQKIISILMSWKFVFH